MDRVNELIEAIKAGAEADVAALLAEDANLAGATTPTGVPLTLFAMYNGKAAIGEQLAAAKPTLSAFEAAAFGRTDALKSALASDQGALTAFTADGFTALHYAAFFAQPAAAKVLVEAGADVNVVAQNPFKVAPLHSAVSRRDAATVRLLIEHGADVNARQQQGITALHAAAAHGLMEILEQLLAAGAEVNARTEDGKTPLAMAIERGENATAERLRSAGAT